MNSSLTLSRSRRKTPRSIVPEATRPELTWTHDGVRHRVTVWPEVQFLHEEFPGQWIEGIEDHAFASAALGVTATQWRRYLEFVPAAERAFLEQFQFTRMSALHLIRCCPSLVGTLQEFPALAAFLTAHV